MLEGTNKAGPVIWHNKGFDLVQTSLPHFFPAKLSNFVLISSKMKSESQKCHPKEHQQLLVTKNYMTLRLANHSKINMYT